MYGQYLPSPDAAAYGDGMDNRAEVSEFLRTRRDRLTPRRGDAVAREQRLPLVFVDFHVLNGGRRICSAICLLGSADVKRTWRSPSGFS